MASIAVFVALGGGAYAAGHVNGKNIKNRTIAAKKVKNNTLGGKQINEKKLGQVPSAKQAQSAATADSASTATTAGSASTATRANSANTANTATTATRATSAANADNAANAAELGGAPPAVYFVSCPAGTTLFGGVCWDNSQRGPANWIVASDTCGNANGRLPTLSELIAYTDQAGTQVGIIHWSSDVVDVAASPTVGIRDEITTSSFNATLGSFAYRCVFYQRN